MNRDLLIAGVGGQGTILASTLLGQAAIRSGIFVRTGETIGMSQRGGSVVSHVRLESKEKGSYIPRGEVDLLIGFELAETVRNLPFLKPSGVCLVNTQVIKPVSVSLGIQSYDKEGMINVLRERKQSFFVDGYGLAQKVGSIKTVNVVLLGVCSGAGLLPIQKEILLNTIEEKVPKKFVELNVRAFLLGYESGEEFQK